MEQVPWLTAREERVWRLFTAVLFLLPDEVEAQLQRDAGLTHFGYGVLSALSEAPARAMRMTDLASMARGSQSRLSHQVASLERRGWVRRERAAEDGRGSVAVLTDAGYAKVAAIAPGHVAAVRSAVFDALSPRQLDELEGICTALLRSEIHEDLGDGPASGRQALVGHRGHLEDDADSSRACPQNEDIRASAETQTGEDLTAGLARISDARSAVDFTELQLIDRARAQGQTWEQIASALGMPDRRQAQTRFRRLRERWPEYVPMSAASR
ncbi:MarR family winged helix-turn-helix transcriptional regulator [Streptomyces sp. NPDC086033]|uniref:MarR family winged helix-turn-helix transcriptional regulator n=1 Tax=Streptomyces sp. NPDC086033 TaxID=3365747 RepID=UPI0037CEF8F8